MKNFKAISICALTFLYAGSAWSASLTPEGADVKTVQAVTSIVGGATGGAVGFGVGFGTAVILKKHSPAFPAVGGVAGLVLGGTGGSALSAEAVPSEELDLKPSDPATLQEGEDLKND